MPHVAPTHIVKMVIMVTFARVMQIITDHQTLWRLQIVQYKHVPTRMETEPPSIAEKMPNVLILLLEDA
jgi:hypothetical protein